MTSQAHTVCCYRGGNYIDGSLTDFLNSNNSDLLLCNGGALILDYYQVHLLLVLPQLTSGSWVCLILLRVQMQATPLKFDLNNGAHLMQDEELKFQRFDFVKLRDPEEIQGMIRMGFKYAERLDRAGSLKPYLSGKRQAPPAPHMAASLQSQGSKGTAAAQQASVMDLDIHRL